MADENPDAEDAEDVELPTLEQMLDGARDQGYQDGFQAATDGDTASLRWIKSLTSAISQVQGHGCDKETDESLGDSYGDAVETSAKRKKATMAKRLVTERDNFMLHAFQRMTRIVRGDLAEDATE